MWLHVSLLIAQTTSPNLSKTYSSKLNRKNIKWSTVILFCNFSILKPGGIWINLGPLLYHYSDVEDEGSIEPTYEDLIIIIKALGFEILVWSFIDLLLYFWNFDPVLLAEK